MATARFIVNAALRKLGRLGAGREPRAADSADTLAALESLYLSWVSSGAFGRLCDVVPTGDLYTARGGDHIYRRAGQDFTVALPELVSEAFVNDYGRGIVGWYGTTITITTVGNDTLVEVKPSQPIGCATVPRDRACVMISDADATQLWFFDGVLKKWQEASALQLDSEAPLSRGDAEGLSAALAAEMSDAFGVDIGPVTIRQAARYMTALTHRYGAREEMPTMVSYW